jgi:hypothetical protein
MACWLPLHLRSMGSSFRIEFWIENWLNTPTSMTAACCHSRRLSMHLCRMQRYGCYGSACWHTMVSRLWRSCRRSFLVLATGPGNPPAVRVWTTKTGRFKFKPIQTPDPLTVGGPHPDPYTSTSRFRRVCLDPAVPISGSAFRVSHLWSHSDMLLLIIKYWHWYITVHFRRISCLDVQNKHTSTPNRILKMSVNRASIEPQQSINRALTERQRYLVLHFP